LRLRVISLVDWLFFIAFPLASVVLAVYTLLTPQEASARLVSCISAMGWVAVSVVVLLQHYQTRRVLKFESKHQVRVGWLQPQYEVYPVVFDEEVESLLVKLEQGYPCARQALHGCTVIFREATWIQLGTLRRVAGEQDGEFIVVGWRPRIHDSALQHELAHRVLQVCAGDPSEERAHAVLVKLGL